MAAFNPLHAFGAVEFDVAAEDQFALVLRQPQAGFAAVQAGVGALAAAVIGFYHSLFGQDAPICVVVEPENAACLYESAKANDGQPHNVHGSLDTIMAGLAVAVAWGLGHLFPAYEPWIFAVAMLVADLVVWRLSHSPFGRLIRAVRDDEDAVREATGG